MRKVARALMIMVLLVIPIMLNSNFGNISEDSVLAYDSDFSYVGDIIPPPQTLDIKFDHITNEEGLTNNYVIEILQDKFGFIWILGETTIARFGGYQFEELIIEADENFGSYYNDFLEDNEGNIWIASNGGIGMYNRYSEKMKQ